MSCRFCSRVKETGKLFLERDCLYKRRNEQMQGSLIIELYLTHDAEGSALKAALNGTESMFRDSIISTEIAITHCPFCGGELNGYS